MSNLIVEFWFDGLHERIRPEVAEIVLKSAGTLITELVSIY